MTDQRTVLQARLDQNYADYIAGFQGKPIEDLILFAPEITAAQQLREELADACDEDAIAFLLHFDDPLELVRGYWEGEITGYDHSGEMGHMLWEIREREPAPKRDAAPTPVRSQDKAKTTPPRSRRGQER